MADRPAGNRPQLLHRDSSHGYTDRPSLALSQEPEAVDEETQNVISLQSRSRFADERRQEQERRDDQAWLNRLRRAEQRAKSLSIDIYREQRIIRQEVLNIEAKLDSAA